MCLMFMDFLQLNPCTRECLRSLVIRARVEEDPEPHDAVARHNFGMFSLPIVALIAVPCLTGQVLFYDLKKGAFEF